MRSHNRPRTKWWMYKISKLIVFIFALTSVSLSKPATSWGNESSKITLVNGRVVLGYAEEVVIDGDIRLDAVLSSSHQSSELGVSDLKLEKDSAGKTFASFQLRGEKGNSRHFSLEVIKPPKTGKRSKKKQEVIVKLPVCIGRFELFPNLKLVDRSKFGQPLRLGRRVLAGRIIVDPSLTHVVLPSCKGISRTKPAELQRKQNEAHSE